MKIITKILTILTLGILTVLYGFNKDTLSTKDTTIATTPLVQPGYREGQLIWSEDFDNLPDWSNDDNLGQGAIIRADGVLNGYSLTSVPEGYYLATANTRWSSATGYPNKHATAEILASNTIENPNRTRSGTGKSFVGWRETDDNTQFHGDHLLAWKIDSIPEIYCEFWINFSNEMIQTYYSPFGIEWQKIFRIYAENLEEATNPIDYFGDENKPEHIWSAVGSADGSGIRSQHSILARGPNDVRDVIQGLPPGFTISTSGGLSMSYSQAGMAGAAVDGSTPVLPDRLNGGLITEGRVHIDRVFGDETHWTKVGIYLKNNSAPGVADGEVMHWIDDQRVFHATHIPWVREGFTWQTWNTIAIGGNLVMSRFPRESLYEEWYAIDDVRVYDGIPANLLTDIINSSTSSMDELLVYPNPTSESLTIQYPAGFKKYQLQVVDALGQVVYNEELSGGIFYKGNLTKQLDVSTFRKGVYIINIQTESDNMVKRVAIQ